MDIEKPPPIDRPHNPPPDHESEDTTRLINGNAWRSGPETESVKKNDVEVVRGLKDASDGADGAIEKRTQETGRPMEEKEKVRIRKEHFGGAAVERERRMIDGATKEFDESDQKAVRCVLGGGEVSTFYKEIAPLVREGTNSKDAKREVRDKFLSRARMKMEDKNLTNEERAALGRFVAKMEQPEGRGSEKFCSEILKDEQLFFYKESVMLRNLQMVATLDEERPGPYTDRNGRIWKSRSEFARAILNGEQYDEGEGWGESKKNAPPIIALPDLASFLDELGREDNRIQELNEEYRVANRATAVLIAEKIREAQQNREETKRHIAEATLRRSLNAEGLRTLAAITRTESGMFDVANEAIANEEHPIRQHDGGRILEAYLKTEEPLSIEHKGDDAVIYFTENGKPDGPRVVVEKTTPAAKGVNTAQTKVIWRRLGKENMNFRQHRSADSSALAPAVVKAMDVGPDPSVFMDKYDAEDIAIAGRILLPLDLFALKFVNIGNGRVDELALTTFCQWLRKETGGTNLEGARVWLTPDLIRRWRALYDEKGAGAAVRTARAELPTT